ncbi:MAG: hypothetical protein R8G66_19370 [Cytophagales bacterium]|nr:hypothetical protein [Cytophagales bacterium]
MRHLLIVLLLAMVYVSNAQSIGGHVGIVHPLFTLSEGETSTIADQYTVGFPIGLTIKRKSNPSVDFEFVPFMTNGSIDNLLIHPGVLFGLGAGFTFGTRLAYETGPETYGFTPLLNKGFTIGNNKSIFMELVLPVRFGSRSVLDSSDNFSAYTIAFHVGIGF